MKSNYYGVTYDKRFCSRSGKKWRGRVKTDFGLAEKMFNTELEAAKFVDLKLISIGKEPRNVFKRL